MTDFEIILCSLIIPIFYVLAYIAGKYDLINLICQMLAEQCKKYMEDNND